MERQKVELSENDDLFPTQADYVEADKRLEAWRNDRLKAAPEYAFTKQGWTRL